MKGKMIQNNTWFKMLITLCVLTLLTGMITGCGKKPADNVGNNEEVTQVAEEVEEQPTVDVTPSEEPEVVEPEPSEEPEVVEPMPSEEPEVVDSEPDEESIISAYSSYYTLLKHLDYDELKIIVWGSEGGQAILSDGDSYQMEKGDWLYLYYPQQNLSINTDKDYIDIINEYETDCFFAIPGVGENLEIAFTAVAPDGTEYEITVYITKDFELDGLAE